jgi:hypothetical protein
MYRPVLRSPLGVLAVTLVAGTASAHVAPSKDDNNRYLKLTPQRDRVRLAYTVFFGEVPGAQARREIDDNHDGTISEAEAQRYGDKLAAEVAANLDVSIDKIQAKIAWSDVTVGMGSPSVQAGAFSIDMITQFCTNGDSHQLILRDRFRLLHPGETEVRIETPGGIEIHHERVGATNDPAHLYKFVGPGGPLADDGIDLQYSVTDKAAPPEGTCAAPGDEDKKRGLPPVLIVGAAALVAFSLAVLVTLLRRRHR